MKPAALTAELRALQPYFSKPPLACIALTKKGFIPLKGETRLSGVQDERYKGNHPLSFNHFSLKTLYRGESNIPLFTLFAEIIIWIVESLILYLTQRKSIRYWEMLLLSLALNSSSFLLGLLLPF